MKETEAEHVTMTWASVKWMNDLFNVGTALGDPFQHQKNKPVL